MRSFFLVALCASLLALTSLPADAQGALRIAGFQAYAFQSGTGRLSDDLLAKGAPQLGNVIAGDQPSTSTLVVVKIEADAAPTAGRPIQVRLRATERKSLATSSVRERQASRRLMLDQTRKINLPNPGKPHYEGFWLAGTGCRTIELKATLSGAKPTASATEILPFVCYE